MASLATSYNHVPSTAADEAQHPGSKPWVHISWVLAGSLAAGLAAAILLVIVPIVPAEEGAVTGAVLCGFGLGWAMLAVLSTRLTDQPQRWAVSPALFMGLSGLLLIAAPATDALLDWVWPPVALALSGWIAVRAHRQLRHWSRRLLLYPVIALLAISAIGGGYTTIQDVADARAYPAPGELVEVGGHRLHLNCTGSGSPTVVLEPGAGAMSSSLGWITPAIARDSRVCVYDRAGRGWSEPVDTPQNANQIATDLHQLLHRGHVPGPYVLAGHSFGGLYVMAFTARYPDEVVGMVLVDSTAPASQPAEVSMDDERSTDLMDHVSALMSASARLGVGHVFSSFAADGLPPRYHSEVSAKSADAKSMRSIIDEYRAGGISAQQAASLTSFDDKPLIVVTAGSGHDATWSAAQDRLATLSTNSTHRVIASATHADLVSEDRPAAATAQAILDVISAVRHTGTLRR